MVLPQVSLRQSCWWLGLDLLNDDLAPLELGGGLVEMVEQFKYLRSLVEASGGVVD